MSKSIFDIKVIFQKNQNTPYEAGRNVYAVSSALLEITYGARLRF